MRAEKYIRRYNHLNGKPVSKDTLAQFHTEITKELSSKRIDASSPGGLELIGIAKRIGKVLPSLNGHIVNIALTPIDIEAIVARESKPVKMVKPLSRPVPSAPKILNDKKLRKKHKKSKRWKYTVSDQPRIHAAIPPTLKKHFDKKKKKKLSGTEIKKPEVKKAPAIDDKPKQHPPMGLKEIVSEGRKNQPAKKLSGSESGVGYKYEEIELGPYKKDLCLMYSDTIRQTHGSPGHGKTVYELKFAQHLASIGRNVLYVAREEFGRSVFDIKLKQHNIGHKNLRLRGSLEAEDMKWAQHVWLDSVTALKLNHEDVENLSKKYPNRQWNVILQSTKGGDFRGSNEWEHLVDIAGEVRNRKMILSKNRLDPDNSEKAEKLLMDDAIEESKKKIHIRDAVKKSKTPKEVKPKAPTNENV